MEWSCCSGEQSGGQTPSDDFRDKSCDCAKYALSCCSVVWRTRVYNKVEFAGIESKAWEETRIRNETVHFEEHYYVSMLSGLLLSV